MLGAIAGDVIGSVHEYAGTKTTDFDLFVEASRFTDDTVLAVAVAECLLTGSAYVDAFHDYVAAYPDAGYGVRFFHWARQRRRDPYQSYGNGSAMRVPAIAYAFETLDEVIAQAGRSAEVTHNHPEGIRGAQATAAALFMARHGDAKTSIRRWLERMHKYDLSVRLDDLRLRYEFDESCQGTVPAALIAFLESNCFEDAVRKAISLGGDGDTLACITGAIGEAFYGAVPAYIATPTWQALDDRLRGVVMAFCARHNVRIEAMLS